MCRRDARAQCETGPPAWVGHRTLHTCVAMGEVKQKRRVATAPGVRQAPRPRDCLFMPPPVQWFRSTFRLPVALYRRWPGKLHRTGNARNGGSSSALVAIRREAARPATGPPSKRGPAVASSSPTPAPGPIAAFLEQQILLARLELGLARRSRTPTRSPPHPTAPSRQSREGTSPAVEQHVVADRLRQRRRCQRRPMSATPRCCSSGPPPSPEAAQPLADAGYWIPP